MAKYVLLVSAIVFSVLATSVTVDGAPAKAPFVTQKSVKIPFCDPRRMADPGYTNIKRECRRTSA